MCESKMPTKLLPENPPSLPHISMNAVAMPRYLRRYIIFEILLGKYSKAKTNYFVGNKLTATAITIFAQLQQLRKITKLSTVELNSENTFKERQATADSNIQLPENWNHST